MSSITTSLGIALDAHQKHDLHQAEIYYRKILEEEPSNGDALHLLGVLRHQKGQYDEAERLIRLAIKNNEDVTEFYNSLGNLLYDQSRYDEALDAYQKAFYQDPNAEDVHLNLGILYQRQRQWQKAMEHYYEAIRINSNSWNAYTNLGNLFRDQKEYDAAVRSYNVAVLLNSNHFEAYYNLSGVFQQLSRLKEAIDACLKSIQVNPGAFNVYDSIGSLFYQVGEMDKAIEFYKKAFEIEPTFIKARLNLGTLYLALNELQNAISCFEEVLQLEPLNVEALCGLGNVQYQLGDLISATNYFQKASDLNPEKLLFKFRTETTSPIIFKDWSDILTYRSLLKTRIEEYSKQDFPIYLEELLYAGAQPPFFLSYQGVNERLLKSQFGDFFASKLSQQYPLLMKKSALSGSRKYKIGFLLTESHEGVFCKLMAGIINHLSREHFDLSIICPERSRTYLTSSMSTIKNISTAFLVLVPNLEDMILQIKDQHFDIIWYYEVGTDPINYFLPFFNLAPIQCTSYGLPVTSGIPAMNYFISSKKVESPSAQDEYRETLVCLDVDPIYFYRPTLPQPLKTRADFGISAHRNIYVCPQNIFKFHPDFDNLLLEILIRDPQGEIILLESVHPAWKTQLEDRLKENEKSRSNPDILTRIRFLPRQTHANYLNLIALADVLLDTIHYTGGTTSFEGLAFGIPIVTFPQQSTRSRQTYGNYQMMDYLECVVDSMDAYVQKAIQLGVNKVYHQRVKETILEKSAIIFENPKVIYEVEQFFLDILEKQKLKESLFSETKFDHSVLEVRS